MYFPPLVSYEYCNTFKKFFFQHTLENVFIHWIELMKISSLFLFGVVKEVAVLCL